MPEADLLTTYAMAVQKMRNLQRVYGLSPTARGMEEILRAEQEVDELTTLHLLPSLAVLHYMNSAREGM